MHIMFRLAALFVSDIYLQCGRNNRGLRLRIRSLDLCTVLRLLYFQYQCTRARGKREEIGRGLSSGIETSIAAYRGMVCFLSVQLKTRTKSRPSTRLINCCTTFTSANSSSAQSSINFPSERSAPVRSLRRTVCEDCETGFCLRSNMQYAGTTTALGGWSCHV